MLRRMRFLERTDLQTYGGEKKGGMMPKRKYTTPQNRLFVGVRATAFKKGDR